MSVAIRREVGNALGRLEADAPRLAARIRPLTGYSNVILALLRSIDVFRETYAVAPLIDTWRSGDVIRHRLTPPRVGLGAAVPPPNFVGPEWLIARTTRVASVLELPHVLAAVKETVELLDGWCVQRQCEPRYLAVANGYPKLIQGLTYVVTRVEAVV